MTDFAAENASVPAGTVITARTGTTSSDTVPGGCVVLWHNTGAGTHVVTLTTNNTSWGLAVSDQTISIAAGVCKACRVPADWADANGRVAVGIDGTANEITYYVLGNV